MNSVRTSGCALWAFALIVGCLDTAVGQSFALQKPDGTPVTSITQNVASGQQMMPLPYKVVSTTAGTEYTVSLNLQIASSFPYFLVLPITGQTPLNFDVYQQAVAPDATYTGTLAVSSTTAGTTPLSVPVSITVGGSGTGTLTSAPATLTFSAQPGTNPQSQFLTVSAPNDAITSFNVAASTTSGGTWLQVFPISDVQTGASNNVTVTVNPTGLALGAYNGTVTLTPAAGGTATTVPVTLNI